MTLYDSMVESYAPKSAAERLAVQQEVMQLIALAGLARGGFFEKAAFYGGTCLHLFYGMERYSEDMDFSLLKPDPSFDFESYFPAIGVLPRGEGGGDPVEAQGAAVVRGERVSQGIVRSVQDWLHDAKADQGQDRG